jgi:tetratricopeptide (TPR) repeat protein
LVIVRRVAGEPQSRSKVSTMARSTAAALCLPALMLCACASAPAGRVAPTVAVEAASPLDDQASSYGLFLAGQSAVNHGDSQTAANLFGGALSAGEADPDFLTIRAFTAALIAGDIDRASALSPRGPNAEPALRHLGALVRGTDALARGDARTAHAILTGPDSDLTSEAGAALLAPWAAAAAGRTEASITHPVIEGDSVSQFFANLDQGRLFERAKRWDEAETAYRALIAKGDPGGLASLALGQMLERRGRRAEALAIYAAALRQEPGATIIAEARTRALAKGPPPKPLDIRQGAAEALLAPASVLVVRKQPELALAYLRLSLKLEPGLGEAWVTVGDVLNSQGDAAGARYAYSQAKPGSPQYGGAREKLAWLAQNDGDKDEALKIARETYAAEPGNEDAAITLADLLRVDEDYAESATILDKVIASKGDGVDWRLLYMRAIDYQESDRWPDAERDLRQALKQKPDDPELLNFLGFSWIDRGEQLPLALSMVQKAVDLDPTSGAMIDSLGWGYYRLGDYAKAVEKLEAAVELEPADPDVNDHLGDAYWRVGRQIEARFQWNRVLILSPSAKVKASVETKLKEGLPASPVKVAGR